MCHMWLQTWYIMFQILFWTFELSNVTSSRCRRIRSGVINFLRVRHEQKFSRRMFSKNSKVVPSWILFNHNLLDITSKTIELSTACNLQTMHLKLKFKCRNILTVFLFNTSVIYDNFWLKNYAVIFLQRVLRTNHDLSSWDSKPTSNDKIQSNLAIFMIS